MHFIGRGAGKASQRATEAIVAFALISHAIYADLFDLQGTGRVPWTPGLPLSLAVCLSVCLSLR